MTLSKIDSALSIFVLLALISLSPKGSFAQGSPTLVIHGGAGTILKSSMNDSLENQLKRQMTRAIDAGYAVLDSGGTATDAVVRTLMILEDAPQFNAGKGSVMSYTGLHELDASIMDGATLEAGAISGVMRIQNPIALARAVMEKSPHVMLYGKGAEEFAEAEGFQFVDNSYFHTEKARQEWFDTKKEQGDVVMDDSHFGTVGCVALDKNGNLCAGTSTGGMMNKRYNRIGDSPIIGAGTYADNSSCGVSCTGHGEYFIRAGVAKEISDRMAFGNMTLKEAADAVITKKLTEMGGSGGAIALDKDGNIEILFNTPGMYRGYRKGKETKIEFYGENTASEK